MSLYKVSYTRRGKTLETEEMTSLTSAQAMAEKVRKGSRAVVILRQVDEQFHWHPANVGKWFLYLIVK